MSESESGLLCRWRRRKARKARKATATQQDQGQDPDQGADSLLSVPWPWLSVAQHAFGEGASHGLCQSCSPTLLSPTYTDKSSAAAQPA